MDDQIQDEVQRQVKKCVCPKQYHMHKITDGQYRVCVEFVITLMCNVPYIAAIPFIANNVSLNFLT
jgi:Growth-Arrest-Specific Protein 2 Domain